MATFTHAVSCHITVVQDSQNLTDVPLATMPSPHQTLLPDTPQLSDSKLSCYELQCFYLKIQTFDCCGYIRS